MWISEIRRPSRRGVLTHPFRPQASAYFFQGWSCWFFSGCTFKWKETDIREINRDCGRKFCSFFLKILMVVFFWVGVPPVQNGTWNSPCGVFFGRSKLICKNDYDMSWRYSSIERSMASLGEACFWVKDFLACSTGGATSFHSTGPKVLESPKLTARPRKLGRDLFSMAMLVFGKVLLHHFFIQLAINQVNQVWLYHPHQITRSSWKFGVNRGASWGFEDSGIHKKQWFHLELLPADW